MIVKSLAGLATPGEKSIARHHTNGPTFERLVQSSPFSARDEQVVQLDLDGHQIACLPFPSREGGSPPQNSGRSQLFLVPLTRKQLIARVRRQTDRSSIPNESHIVRFGQVRIDLLAMDVFLSDRPVRLTAMEFKVLKFFLSNPNRVISRDDMLNQVWGYENYPCTRTVDNQILKLRQKLEAEAGRPVHFRTVHGVGYKFIP
ncbi:MAG TPA: response regulator transcription factor [Edaphobacter sp.]|nr:response regulator transcription factor [Edaphobacter sp.]